MSGQERLIKYVSRLDLQIYGKSRNENELDRVEAERRVDSRRHKYYIRSGRRKSDACLMFD